MKFGQSIIADSDKYYSKKKNGYIYLEVIAQNVLETVNKKIKEKEYYFRFNNHRTQEESSLHKEQRLSATYYALTNLEIPAFGIEVSSEIQDIETKIRYITFVINEFMSVFDIIQEYPVVYVDEPVLKFLNVSINGQIPLSLKNNEILYINSGDEIEVTHIETNYERGISVDIEGYGGIQDFLKKYKIFENTQINVKKDKYECGSVKVVIKEEKKEKTDEISLNKDYFLIKVENKTMFVFPGEEINAIKGDKIEIVDISPSYKRYGNISVNFYGFEPPNKSAEDRGYTVDTKNDLIPFYSIDKIGEKYEIRIERRIKSLEIFEKVYVNVIEPKLEYIVLMLNNQKLWLNNGEVLRASINDQIKIIDVKTNISNEYKNDIKVNFYGFTNNETSNNINLKIILDDKLLKNNSRLGKDEKCEIRVSRRDNVFGKIYVDVTTQNISKTVKSIN
jgi:hypothetical protein